MALNVVNVWKTVVCDVICRAKDPCQMRFIDETKGEEADVDGGALAKRKVLYCALRQSLVSH